MTIATVPKASFRPSFKAARAFVMARQIRQQARLVSAMVLLAFVLCHFTSHIFLIVSVPLADTALSILMAFWWTQVGTWLLAIAIAVHALNALWSIYVRRSLRMPRWEWAQLALGLSIPPLIILHV